MFTLIKYGILIEQTLQITKFQRKRYRHIFIIMEFFSKHTWCTPLKNKNAQTITNEFSITVTKSKRKPLKIECERGTEFSYSTIQNALKVKKYTTLLKIH